MIGGVGSTQVVFDRGTLLVDGPVASQLPDVAWDDRVRRFRAPAASWAAVRAELRSRGQEFHDLVLPRLERAPCFEAPDLRPYQEAGLAAWDVAGRRGTVVLPTGSGKTRVAIAAIARCRQPALVLVPTRVLMYQWCDALAAAGAAEVGCYGDGHRDLAPVTVSTYESAWRHMEQLGDRFALVIVDEVHNFGRGIRDETLAMAVAPWRLGLTGTPPEGEHASAVQALVGPVVFELGLRALTGRYLAEFDLVTLQLNLQPDERRAYDARMIAFRAVYTRFRQQYREAGWQDWVKWAARSAQGRSAMQALNEARELLHFPAAKQHIVASLLERHRGQRFLVFTADNATAYRVAREHLVMPITCEIGRMERATTLERFRQGELDGVVSARVLNEGLDVPDAEVAIIVGGQHGKREHAQRIGRLLRPREGKQAVVYELVMRGTLEVRQAARRRDGLVT